MDNVEDEDEIIALIETNPNCEKRFILLFNFSQRMAKIVFRSKNSLRRFAAGSSAGVLPAVRTVIMCGLYSARRGEGEVVASQPGK